MRPIVSEIAGRTDHSKTALLRAADARKLRWPA